MRAYLAAGNSALVEQLHQVRPRYLQEVGCLARREAANDDAERGVGLRLSARW